MTALTLFPTLLFALAMLAGFLFGLRRGLWRSLFHCLFHGIRVVLALFLTGVFDNRVLPYLFEELKRLTAGTDVAALFSSHDLAALLLVMAQMIVSLLMFFVFMLLLGLLLKPFEMLFAKLLCIPKGKLRWLGGVVGMASGFFILTALLAPFTGTLHLVDTMAQSLLTMEERQTATQTVQAPLSLTAAVGTTVSQNAVVPALFELDHSVALRASRVFGGAYLFERLTTVDYDGISITLQQESEALTKLIYCGVLLGDTPAQDWTQQQIDSVHDLTDALNESDLLPRLIIATASAAQEEWEEGRPFFGIEKPQLGDVLQPTLDLMLHTFATSSPQEMEHSVTTVAEILDVLYRYEVLSALADSTDLQSTALELFGTDHLRTELLACIQSDRNFRVCVPELFRISIRVAEEQLGIENSDQVMADLAKALNFANTAATTEEKVLVLKNDILDLSTEHNLELTQESAEYVSAFLIAEFEHHPEVTKDHLDEWLEDYSNEVLTNGIPDDVQSWLDDAGITLS